MNWRTVLIAALSLVTAGVIAALLAWGLGRDSDAIIRTGVIVGVMAVVVYLLRQRWS